jgi:hypothetical protein
MLDEDEISLNWHIDTTPIGRARSRSVYDFDRTGDTIVLPGRIAYERLREMEQEDLKKRASSQFSSRRNYGHRQRLSEQHNHSPLLNGNGHTPSAARLRALAEYETELAEADARRKREAKEKELANIELISFTVRYEDLSSTNKNSIDQDSLGRLVCEWISPSSSSCINYYTIERQLGDEEWLPIGEKIDNLQNQIKLNISSLLSDENNKNFPSRFRLKAHLENGKIFTSKPTDEIYLYLIDGKRIIIPNVEVLSANSVELTWNYDENEKENIYDIETKEAQEIEWKKISKIPLSQGLARVDNLINAQQYRFRLVSTKLGIT